MAVFFLKLQDESGTAELPGAPPTGSARQAYHYEKRVQ